jgi:hypothetical protein
VGIIPTFFHKELFTFLIFSPFLFSFPILFFLFHCIPSILQGQIEVRRHEESPEPVVEESPVSPGALIATETHVDGASSRSQGSQICASSRRVLSSSKGASQVDRSTSPVPELLLASLPSLIPDEGHLLTPSASNFTGTPSKFAGLFFSFPVIAVFFF